MEKESPGFEVPDSSMTTNNCKIPGFLEIPLLSAHTGSGLTTNSIIQSIHTVTSTRRAAADHRLNTFHPHANLIGVL